MTKTLVIDIGGTKTNLALCDGESLTDKFSFATESSPEKQIELIKAESLKHTYDKVSLSLPGRWGKDGTLLESVALHDWLGFPFTQSLAKALNGSEVIFDTDVICGGLGEYNYGAGQDGVGSLLYVNVGTGIGASLIQNGKPFRSNNGLTLRLHKLVLPFGEEVYSGTDYITGKSLAQMAAYESVEALYKAYEKVEVEAIETISFSQFQLGGWLINLYYLFAPDLMILNGGLTHNWGVLADGAVEVAKEELGNQIIILPSKLKDDAPLYGAHYLASIN